MIVELVGLPASGKSAFAKALVEACGAETNRARPLRVLDGVRGIFCAPGIFLALLVRALRSGRSGGMWYLVKYFVLTRIAELGRAVRRERYAVQALDEGPLQALLSVSSDVSATDAVAMCRRTPATRIVLCMPDEAVRTERLQARPYALRPYLSDSERDVWNARVELNFDILARALETDPRVRKVCTAEDSERAVADLARFSKTI